MAAAYPQAPTPPPEEAKRAFLVDEVTIGLKSAPNARGKIITTARSGAAVTVIARNGGFLEVRTETGAEGWVPHGYVTGQRPARLQLEEAERRVTERTETLEHTRATLEQTQAELATARERNELLRKRSELRELAARRDAAAEIGALERELATRRSSGSEPRQPVPDTGKLRELQRLAEENHRLRRALSTLGKAGDNESRRARTAGAAPAGRARGEAAARAPAVSVPRLLPASLGLLLGLLLGLALGAVWQARRSRGAPADRTVKIDDQTLHTRRAPRL